MMIVGISVTAMSQTNYEYYKALYRGYGYNIGLEQYANLIQGNTAFTNVNFYAGYKYTILAMSNDNDVTDVDIFVYYSDGTLFVKDSDSSSIGIVTFTCSSNISMKVIIKNYSSNTPSYPSTIRYFIAYKY